MTETLNGGIVVRTLDDIAETLNAWRIAQGMRYVDVAAAGDASKMSAVNLDIHRFPGTRLRTVVAYAAAVGLEFDVHYQPAEEPAPPMHGVRRKVIRPVLPAVQRLVERRQELGVSQHTLADALGVTQAYVGRVETGYRVPSVADFLLHAAALEATVLLRPVAETDDETFSGAECGSALLAAAGGAL